MKSAGPGASIKLRVTEALGKDVGRAYARMGPEDIEALGIAVGDTVAVIGKRTTIARAMPAYKELRGKERVQLDGIARQNAGVGLDEHVVLRPTACLPAERVVLSPITLTPAERDLKYIVGLLDGLPAMEGDRLRAALFGSRSADFTVQATAPKGPVLIHAKTKLEVSKASPDARRKAPSPAPSYEDIGGLGPQLQRVREMIELPLRYPEVFERLGVSAPRGVLLHGPPGTGKTLIARTIAHETDARFFTVSGPEIIHKFYGESEAHLRTIFSEAEKKGPSIIFIDEIDAIAPKRERVVGDVEKRVVAQLLALMDGLSQRKNVIVIAATNIPDALDPALRRPGRFDREIAVAVPDQRGRRDILDIHSRGMPIAADVDLGRLAEITHGFVGADLEALCREAAMISLRRLLPDIDFAEAQIPYERIAKLFVTMDDFWAALREVEPSALREAFIDVPNVRWGDIGGLRAVKQTLIEAIEWPLAHAELFRQAKLRPSRGILLVGPPGCGKTLLVRAAASESRVNFISVKGPELLSRYVGDSELGVREVFRKARQAAPCILFLDEIDSLLPARQSGGGGDSGVPERVLGQFLTELDGIEELAGVLVIGATNRMDRLDPAALRPGRFDEIVELLPPTEADRAEIFSVHLRERPLEDGVSCAEIASRSEGLSGAEIAQVCARAALRAVRRVIELSRGDDSRQAAPPLVITAADIDHALEAARRPDAAPTPKPRA